MSQWKAQDAHAARLGLGFGDATPARIPQGLDLQRIGRGDRDRMPLSGQAGREFSQMGLGPPPGRPVTLNEVQDTH